MGGGQRPCCCPVGPLRWWGVHQKMWACWNVSLMYLWDTFGADTMHIQPSHHAHTYHHSDTSSHFCSGIVFCFALGTGGNMAPSTALPAARRAPRRHPRRPAPSSPPAATPTRGRAQRTARRPGGAGGWLPGKSTSLARGIVAPQKAFCHGLEQVSLEMLAFAPRSEPLPYRLAETRFWCRLRENSMILNSKGGGEGSPTPPSEPLQPGRYSTTSGVRLLWRQNAHDVGNDNFALGCARRGGLDMSMDTRCDDECWTANGAPAARAARAALPVLDCARAPHRLHAVRGLRHAMGGGILSHFAAGLMQFGRGRATISIFVRRRCSTRKVQHQEGAAPGRCSTRKVQHQEGAAPG
eukprot:gene24540-biopygen20903